MSENEILRDLFIERVRPLIEAGADEQQATKAFFFGVLAVSKVIAVIVAGHGNTTDVVDALEDIGEEVDSHTGGVQ